MAHVFIPSPQPPRDYADPRYSPRPTLPSMYDLPSEDPEEPGLPDEFHLYQPQLLRETFQPTTYPSDQVFIGADINLYYDLNHLQWYKRPDWFAALGAPQLYYNGDLRMSYVLWQERAAPYLVVELLSEGTDDEDLGKRPPIPNEPPPKWVVYEQILKVPYYVVFDRETAVMQCFRLFNRRYQPVAVQKQRLWLPKAGIGLGIWRGAYQQFPERAWLRFYDRQGRWLLTPTEQERQRAERERQQAMQERQRAEQEKQRAEKLAARLRALGIDPDSLDT